MIKLNWEYPGLDHQGLAYGGNYLQGYLRAVEQMAALSPDEMADKSGAVYCSANHHFVLPYCNEKYRISYPGGRVEKEGSNEEVPVSDCTLLVLYLIMASGLPSRGRWVSFIELPGGPHHYAPFLHEAANPVARDFGPEPEELVAAAGILGGSRINLGDVGVIIPALPRIPLAVGLWAGNEEFPPKAMVLFDAVAPAQLDTAGLFVLGINVCLKLRRARELLKTK
ncbi:MAG: DUF3786 domain-containing protein [Bacillota bacterium]